MLIFGGFLGEGRQTTVELSTAAIFSVFGGLESKRFSTLRMPSINTQYYT